EARKEGLTLLYEASASLPLLNTALVTTQRYLGANRDVVRRMLRGIADATTRLKADEPFYGAQISKFTGATMDPATVHEYWLAAAGLYTVPPRGAPPGAGG